MLTRTIVPDEQGGIGVITLIGIELTPLSGPRTTILLHKDFASCQQVGG